MAAVRSNSNPDRILSIDALRGFDMFWILGGQAIPKAVAAWGAAAAGARLADLDPTRSTWAWLAGQFEHVEWQGFHFYDLIFPLFLFLVGAVLPFSLAKYQNESDRGAAIGRLCRRTLLLLLLGIVYNGALQMNFLERRDDGWRLDFHDLRFAGVLQRIAICYFFAGLIVLYTNVAVQTSVTAALLVGYWQILKNVAAPGHEAGDFSMEGNLAGYLDRLLLPGKFCCYRFGDNEGLLSTMPALATTVLGALAGRWLQGGFSPLIKAAGLAAAGVAALNAGWLWQSQFGFPVVKILWTSSFVLVAGGWSLILLGLFYFIIDVCGWRGWSYFFVVIGANAITLYMLKRINPYAPVATFLFGGTTKLLNAENAEAFMSVAVLTLEWLVAYFLYRNKTFLRV